MSAFEEGFDLAEWHPRQGDRIMIRQKVSKVPSSPDDDFNSQGLHLSSIDWPKEKRISGPLRMVGDALSVGERGLELDRRWLSGRPFEIPDMWWSGGKGAGPYQSRRNGSFLALYCEDADGRQWIVRSVDTMDFLTIKDSSRGQMWDRYRHQLVISTLAYVLMVFAFEEIHGIKEHWIMPRAYYPPGHKLREACLEHAQVFLDEIMDCRGTYQYLEGLVSAGWRLLRSWFIPFTHNADLVHETQKFRWFMMAAMGGGKPRGHTGRVRKDIKVPAWHGFQALVESSPMLEFGFHDRVQKAIRRRRRG